jgi:hypothetical protein
MKTNISVKTQDPQWKRCALALWPALSNKSVPAATTLSRQMMEDGLNYRVTSADLNGFEVEPHNWSDAERAALEPVCLPGQRRVNGVICERVGGEWRPV